MTRDQHIDKIRTLQFQYNKAMEEASLQGYQVEIDTIAFQNVWGGSYQYVIAKIMEVI